MTDHPLDPIANLVKTLRPAVAAIESDTVPVTRHHYGEYMALLSRFADDAGQRKMLANALILAGANKQGVADALRVST